MNVKNYSILSVKILKAGIEISYYDMKTDRNVNIDDKKNSPHPDLSSAITGFNEYLARTHLLRKTSTPMYPQPALQSSQIISWY